MIDMTDVNNELARESEPSGAQVRSSAGLGGRTCDVLGCNQPAACELHIHGDWLPICREHAKNKFTPRRALPPNDELTE